MTITGFQQITLDATTAQGLTIPAGSRKAVVTIESNNVRLRLDGTDPTASVGELIITTANRRELRESELSVAKFIAATNPAKINVHYYQ